MVIFGNKSNYSMFLFFSRTFRHSHLFTIQRPNVKKIINAFKLSEIRL